jgi:hypothetical protein
VQKKVNTTTYNTDTAKLLHTISYGEFGDPSGYEEQLYKTVRGKLFVYGVGGAESKYPNGDIFEITKKDAKAQFGVNE